MDMTMYIDDVELPLPLTYKVNDEPNQTVLRTLGNKVRVQFLSIARSWELGYEKMYVEDNDILHGMFLNQYPGHSDAAPVFRFPAMDVEGQVFITVSERALKYNGTLVEGYVFTIIEIDPYQ